MSTAMNEIKSLGSSVKTIGDKIDTRLAASDRKMAKLEDAVAELQRGSQYAPAGPAGRTVSEGVKALINHMRTGQAPEVQYDAEGVKAATVSNPPSGGYFAVPDFQNRVIERMYNTSPMRQICEVINVTGNIAVLPYEAAPARGKWVGETESRLPDTNARVGIAQIPVDEYTVRISISNTLLEDANLIGIEDYLINAASAAIDRDVGDAFVMGDGHKKPMGLYVDPELPTITSGDASGVTVDMLFDAMGAVPNDALRNARWTMSMQTFLEIAKTFGTTSNYISMPLSQEIPAMLFGYPVTFINTPGIEEGNVIATFGDHSHAYKIVQRLGLQYQRDPYTGADDNLVITRFRTRVGGQLVMPESVVGIKVGA